MPIKRKDVEASLERKGFERKESNHTFFFYITQNGKKSVVRTKTSHGTSHREISENLLARMAVDCKLTGKQFKDLIDCPLSRANYEAILIEKGIIS